MVQTKPKALIVHPNVSFINPTTRLWPALFTSSCEVTFYGTGFQAEDVLRQGLSSFVASQAHDFDLVVISEHVSNPSGRDDISKRARFLQRTYGYSIKEATLFLELKDGWMADALAMGVPSIFTFFEFDPYRVKPEWVEVVEYADPYILGWGEEFVRPIAELVHLNEEVFCNRASDDWHDLLRRRRTSVISMPAFVGEDEFFYEPLSARKRDWSVLGTSYAARKAARQVLSDAGVPMAGTAHTRSLALYDRASKGRIGMPLARSWAQAGFRRALRQSRASYTCGSGLEYPVRKFLEIPASGCLLVARPFPALGQIGFESGRNFIAAEPSELPSLFRRLVERAPDRAQEIASRGQDLVHTHHTLNARIEQFRPALERMLDATFRGSRWSHGQWIIEP